jgi:hypothetical protein
VWCLVYFRAILIYGDASPNADLMSLNESNTVDIYTRVSKLSLGVGEVT